MRIHLIMSLVTISAITLALSASASPPPPDGPRHFVDGPDVFEFVDVRFDSLVKQGPEVVALIDIIDNRRVPPVGSGPPPFAEGHVQFFISGMLDIDDVEHTRGPGTYGDIEYGDDAVLVRDFVSNGTFNTFRVTLSTGGSGPFCLYARFVSEGRQPGGFDTGDPRYEVLDSRGFEIDEGRLSPVRDGDLAVIQSYELFERSPDELVPTFLAAVLDASGRPAMPPPPIRGSEVGGFDLLDDNGWDGIVDLDLCFSALATWDSSPSFTPSAHGDNRPQVYPPTSSYCGDGQVDTLCYHVPRPLRRLRLYVYEEIELGGGVTAYGQIPDGYVSGPGPIYTDENGCANIWFNWTGLVAPDLGVTNDDFPDIIIYTAYEGGHPTVNDPSPLTEEPVFQVGATYDNGDDSPYYIDALGVATPTLYDLGHETGLFPDGAGAGGYVLNEPYDAGSVTNLNERSNLYLITQRALDVDYAEVADQAFYCTTAFPLDGDPASDCLDDRLYLVYNAAGQTFANSEYDDTRHIAPIDPQLHGKVTTPHVLINAGGAYRITTTGHELGHHLLHMTSYREGWTSSYQSAVTTQVHLSSGFSSWYYDCPHNSAAGHSDWCAEFQAAPTIEGWCDFHSHATWFDRDAHQPGFGRSEPSRIDYWPEDGAGALASCDNPLEYTSNGYNYTYYVTAGNIEGLAAKVWWDLYDSDPYHGLSYAAGDYDENLNEPDHALHSMKVLDPVSGLWVDQPMPRDNVSLPLGVMLDAWEELSTVQDGWNGSLNETPRFDYTSIWYEREPDEWGVWANLSQRQISRDPDAPNLADWYQGLAWAYGDDPHVLGAGGYLMESGCYWTQNRD